MEIKLLIKRIAAFLKYAPQIVNALIDTWEMLKEIYNKETGQELEKIKEKANKEEKEKCQLPY